MDQKRVCKVSQTSGQQSSSFFLLTLKLNRLLPGLRVRDPAVDAPAPRVHPEEVLEAEVLAQGPVQDLEGERHELPALVADGRARAAGPDVVVVGHVNVEDELLLEWLEVSDLVVVARPGVVHGADVDLVGEAPQHLFPEGGGVNNEVTPGSAMKGHRVRTQGWAR